MGTVFKCRLCLDTTSKKVDIFKDDFPKMIQLLAGIKVDPNDGLLNTSCLECAKDVKFCMSVRKQILSSHKTLLAEHWNAKGMIYNRLTKEEQKPTRKSIKESSSNKKITRKRPSRKRDTSPETTTDDDDDYVFPDTSECSNDSYHDTLVKSNNAVPQKSESTPESEAGETVVEEITVIQEVEPKFESKSEPGSEDNDSVKLEQAEDPYFETTDNSDIKEPASVSAPSAKRLLKKRNMIAASNRILNQSNSLKDRRYSNVIFIRKSRREKLEKKNQTKVVTTKKEKQEDLNVIIKNGKKYAACEICKREVKKHYMKYHMTTHFPKHFSCDVCGATTRNLRGLRYHKLYWHSSKLDYICDKCGKKYRSKHALDLHNKKEHGGIRDLECNICGKKFFQKMHLKRHVDGIHKKLRPHKCEYCGKDFTKRTHLVTHWRTHTNETPYGCDMCGERFKLKLSLKNHLKRVHNFEEEEKVFCTVCNRGFATEQGLRAHINSRVHEGQKCQYCSEIFTPEYLKTHLRDVHYHVDYF